MSEIPGEMKASASEPVDLQRITGLVSMEFQIEQSLLEQNIPTYYLKQPQETKQAFLRLLKALGPLNLMAILRKKEGRVVLRVVDKLPQKRSNILVNWALFFATIGTTFLTGYMLSQDMEINPLIGGGTFTIAIMAVLGMHEMGHKLTANRKGIDATPPYFIPGPPPISGLLGIGTFGAVIMQKSLPSNRDALFDVGASGPIIGFIVAAFTLILGFPYSSYVLIPKGTPTLPVPLLFILIAQLITPFGVRPIPSGDNVVAIRLHPVAFAGWVGLLVTMLNVLPAAMLDGGHVARSVAGERVRLVLTALSILYLVISGFLPMAILVLLMSMYRHPGPLDDVSSLSSGRKLLALGLVAIFLLCA